MRHGQLPSSGNYQFQKKIYKAGRYTNFALLFTTTKRGTIIGIQGRYINVNAVFLSTTAKRRKIIYTCELSRVLT